MSGSGIEEDFYHRKDRIGEIIAETDNSLVSPRYAPPLALAKDGKLVHYKVDSLRNARHLVKA